MKQLITSALLLCILFTGITAFKSQPLQKIFAKSGDNVLFHRTRTTFTATGAIDGSGTWLMDVQHLGQSALHCINTVTFSDGSGTLIIQSECNLVTMDGEWQIVSGTGDYVNASGNGNLHMAGPEEFFYGTIR